ncbi:MAG: 6-phosphofructokinase, partial [Saprospiraceae bacterium]|nr:6-phosphofructokinase [Saprospiraceae bacterium]
ASGAGGILIPELATDVDDLITFLRKMAKRHKLFNLIIVAEGNENGSVHDVAKIVSKKFTEYETKVAVIGHLQRGGSPSAQDRILASRMGNGAVMGLMEGKSGVMCGLQSNEVVYVSLDDAIKKKGEIDQSLLDLAQIISL